LGAQWQIFDEKTMKWQHFVAGYVKELRFLFPNLAEYIIIQHIIILLRDNLMYL
jgi:hypothetical protein